MGISVQWDDEARTIIRCVFEPRWTWDDYYRAIDEIYKILDGVSYQVNVIYDLSSTHILPKNVFTNARHVFNIGRHPNYGLLVIVGANSFIHLVESTVRRLVPAAAAKWDIQFAKSLEDAYAVLSNRV